MEEVRAGGERARETQGRVGREKGSKRGELDPKTLIFFSKTLKVNISNTKM